MGLIKEFENGWKSLEEIAKKEGTAYIKGIRNGPIRFHSWRKLCKSGFEFCPESYRNKGLQTLNREPYALSVDIDFEESIEKDYFEAIIRILYNAQEIETAKSKLFISNLIYHHILRNDIKIKSYFNIKKANRFRISLHHSKREKKDIINIIGNDRSQNDFKIIHDESLKFLNYFEKG